MNTPGMTLNEVPPPRKKKKLAVERMTMRGLDATDHSKDEAGTVNLTGPWADSAAGEDFRYDGPDFDELVNKAKTGMAAERGGIKVRRKNNLTLSPMTRDDFIGILGL